MLFDPSNFLTVVKFLVTGGGRNSAGVAANDAGFSVVRPLNPPSDLRTVAGLTLTAATAPTVVNVETNGLAIVGAAGTLVLGSFVFQIPKDYDEATDELKINLLAGMAASADTPTVTATMYNKRAATALSANLAPVASAALSNVVGWRTIDASGKSLRAGDTVTINLVIGAHATDAATLYAAEVSYRSTLVSYNLTDAVGVDLR